MEQTTYTNGVLLTTGASAHNRILNIYDIAGNVWEWTLEKTSNAERGGTLRGASFMENGTSFFPNSYYDGDLPGSNFNIGFRISIF